MSIPQARDEPAAIAVHRGHAGRPDHGAGHSLGHGGNLDADFGADLCNNAVLDQDVDRTGGGGVIKDGAVKGDHPHPAQQQGGHHVQDDRNGRRAGRRCQ